MTQYKPSFNNDHIYHVYRAMEGLSGQNSVETLEAMMEIIYQPILKLAQDNRVAVIDLSNTFDINDDDLYRSQIEPSHKGGQVIARLVSHVILNHNFDGNSLFYSERNGAISTRDNDGNWVVSRSSNTKDLIKAMVRKVVQTSLEYVGEDEPGSDSEDSNEGGLQQQIPIQTVDEDKIKQVMEIVGVNDRNKVITLLKIDGTVETAIAAFFSTI